jgi:outer membrane immunogenic protein
MLLRRVAASNGARGMAALIVIATVGPVAAADLPRAPMYLPLPMPAIDHWTGCYVGVTAGGAWGSSNHTAESGAFAGQSITGDFGTSGGTAGGTLGCNYQINRWVLGAEGDLSWINNKGSAPDLSPFNSRGTSTTQQSWLDTVRGRVGFSWDRLLVYGTGGVAFTGANVEVCALAGCVTQSGSMTGWTVGGGIEYAPSNDWTFKIEYLYADFGSAQFLNPPVRLGAATFLTRDVRLTNNILRAGLNYRFTWPDLDGARY